MRYAFYIDGKPVTLAQDIKLSKIANILIAIVRPETGSTDPVQSSLNYARAFEENYAVSFVDARVLGIVDYMMPSNVLAASSKAIYAHYILLAKMMIKNEGVLRLLVSFVMDGLVVKTLDITHLDSPVLYISTEDNIAFMIQATNAFVKSKTSPLLITPAPSTTM